MTLKHEGRKMKPAVGNGTRERSTDWEITTTKLNLAKQKHTHVTGRQPQDPQKATPGCALRWVSITVPWRRNPRRLALRHSVKQFPPGWSSWTPGEAQQQDKQTGTKYNMHTPQHAAQTIAENAHHTAPPQRRAGRGALSSLATETGIFHEPPRTLSCLEYFWSLTVRPFT